MNVNFFPKIAKAIQDVTSSDEDKEKEQESSSTETENTFDVFLKSVLSPDQANNVSEEELFSALIQERISTVKGAEAAGKFTELLNKHKGLMAKADGFIPIEDATKAALREMRDNEEISLEEADKIYSESFRAAQLDGDTSALFDSRGGSGDSTIAVMQLEEALIAARMQIEKFDNGEETAEVRSLNEASNSKVSGSSLVSSGISTTPSGSGASVVDSDAPDTALALRAPSGTIFDGANGFLFKPISENQGTLAVLLPETMAYKVAGVVLRDSDGNVIDEGQSTGYGDLGTREKFSFSKPGGSYPDNLKVEIRMSDGTSTQYLIPDPSQRYD